VPLNVDFGDWVGGAVAFSGEVAGVGADAPDHLLRVAPQENFADEVARVVGWRIGEVEGRIEGVG